MFAKSKEIPLHYQIKKILEEEIFSEKLKLGKIFPSERELVLRFGVSRGTVRKTLSSMGNDGLIERKAGQGTFVAAKEKKITVQPQLGTIGVIMYTPAMESRGFMFKVWQAINDIALRNDYHILLIPYGDNYLAKQKGYLLEVIKRSGLMKVIVTAEEVPDEEILMLHENNIPVVTLNRYTPDKAIPSIKVDHENKMLRALRYLKSLGHRKIAYIGNEKKFRIIKAYTKYFSAGTHLLGLSEDKQLIKMGGRAGVRTFQAVSELLDMDEPPTAVIIQDPFHYISLLNACQQRGISVPEQLSAISLTEFHLGTILSPGLTSYDINTLEMAHVAFKTLDQIMRGQQVKSQKFRSKIIKRNSCSYLKKGEKEDEKLLTEKL